VGPRAILDAVVKRKIPNHRRESNLRAPIIQPVAQRYTDWNEVTYWNSHQWDLRRVWKFSVNHLGEKTLHTTGRAVAVSFTGFPEMNSQVIVP
jgi:hypothetical protein